MSVAVALQWFLPMVLALLWIASDHLAGQNPTHGLREQVGGKRKRVQPFLTHQDLRDSSYSLHGMALISEGVVYRGPLTPWPRDVWALHQHMCEPEDSFTVEVQDVFSFVSPVDVDSTLGVRGPTHAHQARRRLNIPLIEASFLELLGRHAAKVKTLREVLAKWGWLTDEDFIDNPPKAVRMPAGLRDKVLSRTWPWILLLGRWSVQPLVGNFPAADWLREKSHSDLQASSQARSGFLTSSMLLEHMAFVRQSVLRDDSCECADSEQSQMEATMGLTWLSQLHSAMLPDLDKKVAHRGWSGAKGWSPVKTATVVCAHLAASLLGNKHILKNVAGAVINMLLPHVFAPSAVAEMLSKLPSKSKLSRTAVNFDAALVMLARKQNEELRARGGCARYLLCDSSPQLGRDWFLSKDLDRAPQDRSSNHPNPNWHS